MNKYFIKLYFIHSSLIPFAMFLALARFHVHKIFVFSCEVKVLPSKKCWQVNKLVWRLTLSWNTTSFLLFNHPYQFWPFLFEIIIHFVQLMTAHFRIVVVFRQKLQKLIRNSIKQIAFFWWIQALKMPWAGSYFLPHNLLRLTLL